MKTRLLAALVPALAGVVAILVAGPVILLGLGADPLVVGAEALEGVTSGYGFFQVLFKATPLILCGLAVAVPLSAGLFNVGGEGQLLAGGLAAAVVTHALVPSGATVAFVAGVLAAAAVGAACGGAAGALRHFRGVHEVIATIMLNFILAAVCGWILSAHAEEPGTAHTPEIPGDALFTRLSSWVEPAAGSTASTSLLLALALAVLLQVVMQRTVFGFELRASGGGPVAALHAGIPAARMVVGSLALGGALAGLAGAHFVLGARRFFEEGMSGGEGFLGIAVALMARSSPLGCTASALVFAALSQAGLQIAAQVPREVVLVLQGLVVLVLGGTDILVRRIQRAAAAPAVATVETAHA